MQKHAKGQISDQITAVPNSWYPVFIVRGARKSMMIDAGVNLLGSRYFEALGEALGNPGLLDYLFLTHSHYDHIGAAAYLKRRIPHLLIGAHERLGDLLCKPSVLTMMNRLSDNHVQLLKYNKTAEDLTLEGFEIDINLKQGDAFNLGGLTCQVYETPGHTRDSLSFYFPEIKTLFPGEACGVLQGETGSAVQVEFLSSYDDYTGSLTSLIELNPERICLGHGWVLTGLDATDYLKRSLDETFLYRALIEDYLDAAGGDAEKAIGTMAHDEYDNKGGIYQDRTAYLTNLSAQVKHIAGLRERH